MENNKIIVGFVFLIIGVILAGVIPSVGTDTYRKTVVTDEAVDISVAWLNSTDMNNTYPIEIANAPSGWKADNCPITSVTFGNSSTDYTVTTDYVLTASTGILTVENTDVVKLGGNSTLIDYTYCSDNYQTNTWGRTSIQTTMGLFALAVFGIGIAILYSIWKESGLMSG